MLTFGTQAELSALEGGDGLSELQRVVRGWNAGRLARPYAQARGFTHSEALYAVEGARVWEFLASQHADGGGTWNTELRAYVEDERPRDLTTTLVMRADAGSFSLAPPHYYVETPRFFRELHTTFSMRMGDSTLSPTARLVATPDDVRRLLDEIASPARAVPVVVVTAPAREPSPVPGLAGRLAAFLYGLAVVADVDRLSTFEMTNALGRGMSCFDGGIRLYWPGWSPEDPTHRHPLLMGRRVAVSAAHDPARPEALVASTLMTLVTRAAAARFEYPSRIQLVVSRDRQRRLEADLAARSAFELAAAVEGLTKKLNESSEMMELALTENTRLTADNERLARELTAARNEVRRLRARLEPAADEETAEEPSPWEIQDPIEAIERARTDFSGTLIIPDNVDVETNLEGGFVYHALLALHELAQLERKGQATNKREQLRQLLAEHVGVAKETYKVGDTGVTITNPENGVRVALRERVHLKEGRPAETESIYWMTIGDDRRAYKYLVGRIGRHA